MDLQTRLDKFSKQIENDNRFGVAIKSNNQRLLPFTKHNELTLKYGSLFNCVKSFGVNGHKNIILYLKRENGSSSKHLTI